MGLQIRDANEVFKNLVDWITAKTDKITDFNVGSAIRTLTESIAIQFEEFYFDMKQNVTYAIENSIYNAFEFELEGAVYASGIVTVKFTKPLPDALSFPKGTIFCTSSAYGNLFYESDAQQTALKGEMEIDIAVTCKTLGEAGNIPAGAIDSIATTNSIIDTVSNKEDFTNGRDTESGQERKKRFQVYIKTLARATKDAVIQGALEVEGVDGVYADDSYIGFVKLYVHDSDGELPQELRSKVLSNLNNYRAGGIEIEVLPVVKKDIDLDLTIVIADDYDVNNYSTLMKTLVVSFLNDYTVSNSLYISDVVYQLKNVYDDLIINIVTEGISDVMVSENEVIRAGEINVTCVNISNWRS